MERQNLTNRLVARNVLTGDARALFYYSGPKDPHKPGAQATGL